MAGVTATSSTEATSSSSAAISTICNTVSRIASNASLAGSTSTYTSIRAEQEASGSVVKYVEVLYTVWMEQTCENYRNFGYQISDVLVANPDISGSGVLTAFLVTAWLALLFLAGAYWLGLLPSTHFYATDRRCFGANSRRCKTPWKLTLDKIIFIFSDQQLITGLAILIAGFSEAFFENLDGIHWSVITYLAWMSSTVHLITLSMLGDQLNENKGLRNIRIIGMLILLALLAICLIPTTANLSTAIPVRCSFSGSYDYPDSTDQFLIVNAIISYVTLFGSYFWKLCHLFKHSTAWFQKLSRTRLQAYLERRLKAALKRRQPARPLTYIECRTVSFLYVYLVLWTESLRSFMATMLALCFTLAWGTTNLLYTVTFDLEDVSAGERTMSFGQLLPLLLLLQPALAMTEHFFKTDKATSYLEHTDSTSNVKAKGRSCWSSMSQVIQHESLLTADEKLDGGAEDPVIDFLFEIRAFKVLIYVLLLFALGYMATAFSMHFISLGYYTGLLVVIPGLFGIFFFLMPMSVLIAQLCSRRLR